MKQPEDTLTMDLPLPSAPPRDLAAMHTAQADAMPGDMPASAPAWRRALEEAIATDPRGKAGVAARMGAGGHPVTRAYVSRVASGDLAAAPPARFVQRVEATLMRADCPHLRVSLSAQECRSYAGRTYAQINQFQVDHWRACLRCPHNAAKPAAATTSPDIKAARRSTR